MTTALATLEAQLMSAIAALESAEARVQALEVELALTQQRAVSAEGSLVHLETARAEVAASEAALQAELADMRQSTSWRATAPIRSVAGALRRNHVAP
jgi:predicted  nucleic acid-binding Zn-ribbon protein